MIIFHHKFKICNKFTISDGSTTYVNNKVLIYKDVSYVEFESNDYEALLILNFEDGLEQNQEEDSSIERILKTISFVSSIRLTESSSAKESNNYFLSF